MANEDTKDTMSKFVKFLTQYSPCDVSDALVKFGFKNGGFFPNLTRFSPSSTTVVGTAYTVLYAPLDDPRPAVKGGYIDSVPKGSVVCVALVKELQTAGAPYTKVNNALYGGLMSTRAKYLGASGSVVFGRIRDLDEHRALEYPVFAYGVGTTAPGPVVKVVGVNVPIEILVGEGEYQTIEAGDVVVGDENGIVIVPVKKVDEEKLMEYIPKRVEADQLVARDINEGKPAGASQKARRANL